MSLNDLERLGALDEDSEEDEDMYIPIPFRFHDLAQRDEYTLLKEEIKRNANRDYNPKEVHLSLDQEDNVGFTPLHIAIMRGNLETIKVCLENGVKLNLKTEGIPYSIFLLLVASSKNVFSENLYEVLKQLVIAGNVDTMTDRLGRTVAHVAASYNMLNVLSPLLEDFPELVEKVDKENNSVLHYACKSNSVDVVSYLMDTYPQLSSLVNNRQQNALHISLQHNALDVYQALIRYHTPDLDIRSEDMYGCIPIDIWKKVMEQKRELGCSGFPHAEKKPLILVTTPYDEHKTCENPPPRAEKVLPPEQIQRCRVLVNEELGGCLLNNSLKERVEMEEVREAAPISALLRVHDMNYVMKVMKTVAKQTDNTFGKLDIDTVVSSNSFLQARRAVQTVLTAIDRMAATTPETGPSSIFCCVRPPGHHIGTHGPINNPNNNNVSQGFCLFNNVAIAAAYARATYACFQRVAIVDFDIHHGNGTEDCIQHVCPCSNSTTAVFQNMSLTLENYSYKPWKDESDSEHIFFASIHGYGKLENSSSYFYPGSGQSINRVQYVSEETMGMKFAQPTIVDAYTTREQGRTAYFWREQFRRQVLPRLLEFKPDLILISAGFDGHANDVINNGFGGLSEVDFAWVTGELVKIANSTCGGRIISVLEGGYNVLGGCASPLAQSVLAHVEALCSHTYEECNPAQWEKESAVEQAAYEEEAREKGEAVLTPIAPSGNQKESQTESQTESQQGGQQGMEEEEEEGSFDFDAMSEEEEEGERKENPEVVAVEKKPIEEEKVPASKPAEPSIPLDDEGSEDLENYEMPDIEEGELDKIIDPFANETTPSEEPSGRRKRERKKVDYVALEALLKKEEEEMRQKMLKKQEQQE